MYLQQRQPELPIQQLRAVVLAANEFTECSDVDSILRHAVEFARVKLGLERTTVFMADNGFLHGTYGTDMRGETTDEHNQQFPINERWSEHIHALEVLGIGWTTVEEMRYEWNEDQAKPLSKGWIALTPIRSAQKLIGMFCNDTAISGSACDPNIQELVSVFCSLLGNIIERKRAESTLAEERNLLRTLIDSVPDYIYAKDSATRLILSNVALAHLAGFNAPEQLIGQTVFDLFPEELAQNYFLDDQMIMDLGQSLINREERVVDPAGNEICLLTTKIPLRNQQGTVVGLVGVSRDVTALKHAQNALQVSNEVLELRIQERIAELKQMNAALQAQMTERQQAEASLQRERNLLRTLIDTVPTNVYIKDTQSRFVDANTETVLMLGGETPDDLIGKTDFDFFPADLAGKYFADEQTIIKLGQPLLHIEEMTIDYRTGQPLWFLTTKAPIRNEHGEVTGVVGVGLDITTRKEMEKALEEERTLLRTVIDNLPAEVYVKDTQSRFLNANIAVAHNVGLATPEELIGKTDFDFTTYENALQYYQAEQALFSSNTPIVNRETLNPDKTVWRLENKIPLRDPQGKIIGLVGFNWNITERKQAEEAQRESERLRIALEKEKELGDLKTKLMITISHEFRTPLSVAYASAELLEKYYERMSQPKRQEHLHRVETQIKKLTGMLEDIALLIHARFERLALNLESADLRKLCEAALLQLQDIEDGHHRIEINSGEPLPKLMLDVRRMTYVLTNLLSNALKYSDKATNVSLELFQQDDFIVFRVTDQGIGIPHEQQAHIFEPFYRADNVGTIGGTGLGLSIVKEIIELHQGKIAVKSEVNHGTQVTVFLPGT